ncbi:hypothetical protein D3C80_1857810 [compost metagenome]
MGSGRNYCHGHRSGRIYRRGYRFQTAVGRDFAGGSDPDRHRDFPDPDVATTWAKIFGMGDWQPAAVCRFGLYGGTGVFPTAVRPAVNRHGAAGFAER